MKRFDVNRMTYFSKEQDGVVQCLIPIPEVMKVELEVRCEKDIVVNVVTEDGESIPLVNGKIVRWNGKLEGVSAVEIVADTGFWYSCRKSRWFEFVDPNPMAIELVQTKDDVLRSMIEERLRAWEVKHHLDRPLSEDEKDELVLDLVRGDLEFDDEPDAFGLGYEERLEEFVQRSTAKQDEPPAEPAAVSSVVEPNPVPPAADPKNSSST